MKDLRSQFADHGLRCTKQRLALYAALSSTKSHPTADELHRMVLENSSLRVSLATVYNTLEAFSEAGLCRKLPTTTGSARYDADVSDHLHIRCRRTGRFHDVPADLSGKLLRRLPGEVIREIERRMNVRIDRVQIQFIGETGKDE